MHAHGNCSRLQVVGRLDVRYESGSDGLSARFGIALVERNCNATNRLGPHVVDSGEDQVALFYETYVLGR